MRRTLLLLIPVFLLFAVNGMAQDSFEDRRSTILEQQQNTRSQIDNLREQINTYSERLGYASERYEQMYRQYQELERVITLQEEQLRQMNREQQQITQEIRLIEENLEELEERLKQLVEEYKETIIFLYKNGRTTEMALLLTSGSLNQLLVRSYYLARFDEYQKEQVAQIEQTQADLEEARNDLQSTEERNREALAEIRDETETLEQQKELQSRNVELLRRDRDNISEQVHIRQRQLEELNEQLDNLIAEEERIRREAAAGERPSRAMADVGEDELDAFASTFRESKGQLPWPVDNGTITQRFGVRTHPVFNTQTNIPGIEISAPPRSTVRVVNSGYVIGVEYFPLFGETVLVHHGGFYTAYGNMSEIYVRKNQILSRGDVVGLSGDEDSLIGEVLFFMVRDGTQNVNPEEWLQSPVP
ncbi:MAG: peptidoglycan DD-metalloendopeptidase family protein [Balneolaceae bacterium]|nr:peptidoglycan DD-metalloendopeptidase family protein [Balneolaceae bacterium]